MVELFLDIDLRDQLVAGSPLNYLPLSSLKRTLRIHCLLVVMRWRKKRGLVRLRHLSLSPHAAAETVLVHLRLLLKRRASRGQRSHTSGLVKKRGKSGNLRYKLSKESGFDRVTFFKDRAFN